MYGVLVYVAKAIAGLAVGRLITGLFKWKAHNVVNLLIGLIVLAIVMLIPIVGWLACFVVLLWTLGGWAKVKGELIKEMK